MWLEALQHAVESMLQGLLLSDSTVKREIVFLAHLSNGVFQGKLELSPPLTPCTLTGGVCV